MIKHIETLKHILFANSIQFSNAKAPVISGDSKPVTVHIAKAGVFKGYRDGEIELTPAIFDQAISNFNTERNPLPVYKGHADVVSATQDSPYEPECEGWILGLARDNDDLYALVEFSDDMQSLIKAGKYKFTSIYMRPDELDRESGDEIGYRMISLAITNQPFLDGLKPISLSNKEKSNIETYLSHHKDSKMSKTKAKKKIVLDNAAEDAAKSEDTMDKLQKAKTMETDETLTTDDPMSVLEAAHQEINPDMDLVDFVKLLITTFQAEEAEEEAEEAGATPEEAEAAEDAAAGDSTDGSAEEEGEDDSSEDGSDDGSEDESADGTKPAVAASKKVVASAKKDVAMTASIKALSLELSAMKKKNAELAKKNAEHETLVLSSIVQSAVEKGHLLPAEREAYVELGKKDRASFEKLLSLRGANPKVVMSRLISDESTSKKGFDKEIGKGITAHQAKILQSVGIKI